MDFDPCSPFVLSSAIEVAVPKYARGVAYSNEPSYLPGFGPAGTEQKKTNWWAWGLGALAVGGLAWVASRGGGVLANPFPTAKGVHVRFWSLSGPLKTVSEQHFASLSEATEAVRRCAEAAGFRNVKLADDPEWDEYRWTATTPGGRAGRNVARGVFEFDDDDVYTANPRVKKPPTKKELEALEALRLGDPIDEAFAQKLVKKGWAYYVGGSPTISDEGKEALIRWSEWAANPGVAAKKGFTAADADPEQLRIGTEHELEHTGNRRVAAQTALDHLAEDENYYTHLAEMEARVKAEEVFGKWDWWRDSKTYRENPHKGQH